MYQPTQPIAPCANQAATVPITPQPCSVPRGRTRKQEQRVLRTARCVHIPCTRVSQAPRRVCSVSLTPIPAPQVRQLLPRVHVTPDTTATTSSTASCARPAAAASTMAVPRAVLGSTRMPEPVRVWPVRWGRIRTSPCRRLVLSVLLDKLFGEGHWGLSLVALLSGLYYQLTI
jgi:hypothetical protein